MILSSKLLSSERSTKATVCIVGAGPAGITLANELSGCTASVLLLETGSVRVKKGAAPDHYHGTATTPHVHPALFRRCGFGGSTTIWGGRCVPYDAIDFERRDYVSDSGWPISYEEVAKHYPRAMQYCDAGAFEFSCNSIGPSAMPLLPGVDTRPFGIRSDVIERYSLPTDFGKRYRTNLQRSRNVRIVTEAHVVRLLKSTDSARIVAAEFVGKDGRKRRVEAEIFVLCAGGIETPRLLLASDPESGGLGNQSDRVGRFYMCHIEGRVGVLEAGRNSLNYNFERTRDRIYCRRKIQIDPVTQRARKLLNIAFRTHYPDVSAAVHGSAVLSAVYLAKRSLIPEYRRILQHDRAVVDAVRAQDHLRNIVGGIPELAVFSKDWVMRRVLAKRKLPYVLVPNADGRFPLEFNAEQTPQENSRITLARERDAFGMPRVHIDWRMANADVDSICRSYRLLKEGIDASGAARLSFNDDELRERIANSTPIAGHHIGTTRMANSSAHGVVDTNCAVFGLPNLYVVGSAVFPTSSHANPTLTIVALALRLAERVRAMQSLTRNAA